MLRFVPEITAEQENFRLEPIGPGAVTIRRDPVEPVPVGSYIVRVFKITAYDPDCDGSLMARLAAVDKHGAETGAEEFGHGLYPDAELVIDDPEELWRIAARLA
jgi:hypothetical protein